MKSHTTPPRRLGVLLAALATSFACLPVAKAATSLRLSTTQLNPESEIEIIFDRAVVGEPQLQQSSNNALIGIKPKLPGNIVWKAANIARFVPSQAPLMGTEYTFSVLKGQQFLDGKKLPSGKIQTVKSEPFKVSGSSLRSESKSLTRELSYYVYFNDAIDPAKSPALIKFINKEGVTIGSKVRRATWGDIESSYRRGSTWNNRFREAVSGLKTVYSEEADAPIPNALMISPVKPLPPGDDWRLNLSEQLTNEANNAVHLGGHNVWIGDIEPFELENAKAFVEANKSRQIHLSFNTPPNKNLTQEQLASLISVKPKLEEAKYTVKGDMVIVEGKLRKSNNWNVSVNPAMLAMNGLMINKATSHKLKFLPVATGLALPAFDSAQYAHGSRLYGIETVNLESLRVRVKLLEADKAVRTMQGYRHYKGSGHNNHDISPTHPMPYSLVDGKTVYDRTIHLDNPLDTSKDVTLDWNAILPQNTLTSTFFISVEGTAKEHSRGGNRIAQSFIQLTDIGLCWKINEQQAMMYAFSCKTGKPLPNVQLQVFNEDAEAAGSTKTDKHGIARLPRQDAARHLRASLGNDSYIVPFDNTLDTVSLWRFPVDIEWNHLSGWKRNVMMFTDRNLYRPGETVQLKGIVRQFLDNQIKKSADKTAQLVITDSKRRVLMDQEITFSDQGSFDFTLKLPAETVGRFRATLTFPEDPSQADEDSWIVNQYRIFNHNFQVQEFRRNAFEVTSNIPPAAPGARNIEMNLEAHYYQGQPVKEGLVEWSLSATQSGFYPNKFRDFYFGDHRSYDPYYWSHYFGYGNGYGRRQRTNHNGEAKLDTHGKSKLSFELPELTFPTALAVDIHAEVTDARDQTLSKSSRTTVHPANTYVGISRVDRLVRVGQNPNLELIAVDTQGEQRTEDISITAIIEREYYEPVKVRSADGRASVKNTKHTEQVSEQQLTIPANQALILPFTPEKAGRHIITLKGTDNEGHAYATASKLYVYGAKEYPWASEDGMKIKLVPEKQQYQPNDTARILVMTPIEGTALVTVERSNVIREYRRELKADAPVIEIPLSDMDAPNAYVSVMVIRGADASPRKHKEPVLKLGYCTLNVKNVKDRLAVNLEVAGSQHRPGESTTLQGSVTFADGSPAANAEVTLYAEDEGTLAVMGYRNPDPMSNFHAPRPLLVQCGSSFSTFIAENPDDRYFGNKGFTIGGGGDAFGAGGGVKLKTRTDFNPCAVWQPSLRTDGQGKFSATYTNPDTLTRYRVIAVALHGDNKFGSASSDYTVDKPLMLEPAAPRYASEGDRLQPKVLVQNNSKFEGTWKVSLETSSLTQSHGNAPLSKTITLQPGGAGTVYFDVHFVETGKARWTWTASPVQIAGKDTLEPALATDLSDRAETRFEITYPVPLMRQMRFVSLNNGNQNDLLKDLDQELLKGRGKIELELSNSLLLEAGGAVDFLLHYPYGCVEQTSSSLMPWFAVRDLKGIVPGFKDKNETDIAQAIQAGADRLLTMQTPNGGLAYWPGGDEPTKWASAYGGMALLLAREHGAMVPPSAIEQLTDWISASLKEGPDKKADHRWRKTWDMETRARALYVLALAGKTEAALQNKMIDQAEHLNPSARCFLALAIHHSGGARDQALALIQNLPPRKVTRHWMRYHSDDAMAVLAWSEIDPTNENTHQAMRKLIDQRNPRGHWRTTWCNSWALQAMASYARNVEKNQAPSTLQLIVGKETKHITLDQKSPTEFISVPLQEGLQIIASSNNRSYARIRLSSKPEIAPSGPWAHDGLSITRRYNRLLPDGTLEPMTQPRVGDLIQVNLDITFSSALDYVVIEDRIPALFEAVNNQFESQRSRFSTNTDHSWKITHKELRSDRAVFFFDRSWGGSKRTLSYLARVTSAGTAVAPSAKVEAMYDPEQLALSKSQTLTTLKKGSMADQ
ncbi:hypothetical protein HW115_15695 [Verrucomicrobiaceae bacterium N1E253]|uniref:Alpha-2-macroglobulin n=1 Tax=Oceaniferula marina TaxID=2748318 RepID=A0A851GI85_9BACT|nr:MG2 domain-containing protein [Oceaniferula marina]NWK57066.1 hypothetical protein [Oceaniferula marina]